MFAYSLREKIHVLNAADFLIILTDISLLDWKLFTI